MRAPRILVGVACLTAVLAAACDDDEATTPTIGRLAGNTFTSTTVEGHQMVAGTNVVMTFDDDGVAVNAGCNTLRGAVTIAEGRLEVGPMAQTMMACTDDLMAQDQFLAFFFEAHPTITLDGRTLRLTGHDDTTITAEIDR
jgi:heat shock protein HslJ